MSDYDVKAACEEWQTDADDRLEPHVKHGDDGCICPELQAAFDAGEAKGQAAWFKLDQPNQATGE